MRGPSSGTALSAGLAAGLALSVAHLCGAALNYLFQVHAATVLDAATFGLLSAWLARVTLVGVVGTVVQFVSLEHRLPEDRWRNVLRIGGVLSLGVVVGHVMIGSRVPDVALGVAAVAGTVVLNYFIGQLQARLQLGVAAAALLVSTALRFVLPFAWAREARGAGFYVAHAGAFFAGVVAVGLVTTVVRGGSATKGASASEAESERASASEGVRLRRPVLLAFATVLFPIIDVLVVSSMQDAATTGAFSRVALASRVVFFGGSAGLAVLLPHQMHQAKTGAPLPAFASLLERWLTIGALAFAVVLAAMLDRVVLHPAGEERTWLFASCVAGALLVGILGRVNRFASDERLGVAAACALGVVVASLAAAGASLSAAQPVTRYAVGAAIGYALVLGGASLVRGRPRSGAT